MTDHIRQPAAAAEAAWRNATEALKREGRGIPSRWASEASSANAVVKVEQVAHGWALNTILRNDPDTGWEEAIADDPIADENLFIVTKIVDEDNVLVLGWGLLCIDDLADFTMYYLSATTPGGMTLAPPSDPDQLRRAVIYHLSNKLCVFFGPAIGLTHSHTLSDLQDSAIDTPTDGQSLLYDAASQTWKNADLSLAALPHIAGISVVGRAANSTGAAAAITASTTGDVLYMGATALQWGQLQTASYADASVSLAKVADLAGLSVIGRSANSTGVMAAITGTDGQALRVSGTTLGFGTIVAAGLASDAVTTVKILDANVTNAKLDDIIAAGGPTGTTSTVPVITYNTKGRLTAVSTATITPAAIGASDTSHNHTVDSLSNVTITSKASGDFLKWNGSAWINYNLGNIGYASASNIFFFGTASPATPIKVGIAGSSRLIVGNAAACEWVLSGDPDAGTEKVARMHVASGSVSFKDQGTNLSSPWAFGSDGTEVMLWTCSGTTASRRFDFKLGTQFNNIAAIKGTSSGLHLSGNSAFRFFRGTPSDADMIATSAWGTSYLRWEWDSTYTAFGNGSTGAFIFRDSSDLTNRRIAINANLEIEIRYGSSTPKIVIDSNGKVAITYASSNTVTIDSADFVGTSKAVKLREVDVCDAGVAKKMLMLASAAY